MKGVTIWALSQQWTRRNCSIREDAYYHEHHQMVNTKNQTDYILAAKDGEALYSQQKQDQELKAHIINSYCQMQTN